MKKDFDFNSSNIILFIWHWKKVFIIVGVVAVLMSALFSSPWFITPKYKSTVVMFPTSTNSISKALLAQNVYGRQDVLEFGEESEAEQMLQILNSTKIKERIIEKYNLAEHYDIDPEGKFKMTKLHKEFDSNISYKRTEFMAVEITVMDKDPQMAADIANDIADLLDTVKNEMQRERALQAFKIVEVEYLSLCEEIQWKEDSLNELRKLGIYEYDSQVETLGEQYAIALSKGNLKGAGVIEKELDNLAKYGGAFLSLNEKLLSEHKQLASLQEKYKEAKVDAETSLPQKFLVDRAYKAEKKSYPVRWLIVVVSTFASLLLVLISIIAYDTLSNKDLLSENNTEKE
ncbi:MAG: Wzz/FepE/Etk N-terminal domain-containing protein [Bacteroidales bacterium]|nr:Wzz/FepE/Etk N-terminal domain-containing protein [Bacteroidales bacterium]